MDNCIPHYAPLVKNEMLTQAMKLVFPGMADRKRTASLPAHSPKRTNLACVTVPSFLPSVELATFGASERWWGEGRRRHREKSTPQKWETKEWQSDYFPSPYVSPLLSASISVL